MPMMLVSDPILSPQDNKCNIFYSTLFINDGGRCYIIYLFVFHTTHSCYFFSYMYIVWCIQLVIYCMVERWKRYTQTYCLSHSPPSAAVDCYI